MRSSEEVRAVFFDIDDTLYDFWKSYHVPLETVRAEWSREFGHLRPEEFRAVYWRAYASIPEEERERLIAEDLARYQATIWERVLALAGSRSADAPTMARRCNEVRYGNLKPKPGARQLLSNLRMRTRLGIVSNGPGELQRWKLKGLGLADLFDATLIFVSGEVGWEKPDPRIFERALRAADAPAQACVMVGDRLDTDLGAKLAGMRFVHLEPGAPEQPLALPAGGGGLRGKPRARPHETSPVVSLLAGHRPDATVRSFDELTKFFSD